MSRHTPPTRRSLPRRLIAGASHPMAEATTPHRSSRPVGVEIESRRERMTRKHPAETQAAADAPPNGWQWLTKKEAAEYLGVTIGWVDAKTAEGVLPHYKFGHYVRYLR